MAVRQAGKETAATMAAAARRIVGHVELLKGNFVDDDATELGSVVVMRHHEEVIPPYKPPRSVASLALRRTRLQPAHTHTALLNCQAWVWMAVWRKENILTTARRAALRRTATPGTPRSVDSSYGNNNGNLTSFLVA